MFILIVNIEFNQKMHVCQNLQIMIRTIGLGCVLGRIIGRALGREDHYNSDDQLMTWSIHDYNFHTSTSPSNLTLQPLVSHEV